jgi:hypothetical protein
VGGHWQVDEAGKDRTGVMGKLWTFYMDIHLGNNKAWIILTSFCWLVPWLLWGLGNLWLMASPPSGGGWLAFSLALSCLSPSAPTVMSASSFFA